MASGPRSVPNKEVKRRANSMAPVADATGPTDGVTPPRTASFDAPAYRDDDVFLFGSETAGLPQDVLDRIPEAQRLRLPMRPHNRSLNLSNAVAVMVFEAWRQAGFAGGG